MSDSGNKKVLTWHKTLFRRLHVSMWTTVWPKNFCFAFVPNLPIPAGLMRSIITPDHILSHPDVTFCEGDELYHITYISSYHYPDPGFITIMTPHQSSYLVLSLALQSSSLLSPGSCSGSQWASAEWEVFIRLQAFRGLSQGNIILLCCS